MKKQAKAEQMPWFIGLPISIFIGILLVISIPGATEYFEKLFSMILAVIFLGIIVGAIILAIFWFFNRELGYNGYP